MCWFSYMFCQLLLDRWSFTSRLCYSKLVEFCIKNSGFTRKVVKIVLKSVQILRFILAIQFALPPNDSNSFRETFARAHIWCNGFIVMLARKTDNSIVKSSLSPGTRKETFIQGRDRRENSGRAQSDGKSQKKSIVPHVTSPRYYCVISVERAQFLYF